MRKMRVKDDSTDLNKYFLVCNKKRNKPRIYYKICENCRYRKKCVDYNAFLLNNGDINTCLKVKQRGETN